MAPTYGHAWNQRRRQWAQLLPVPCARCGQPVHPDDAWDLDHLTPAALGGGPDTARPAHQRCNRSAGVETREAIKHAAARIVAEQGATGAAGFFVGPDVSPNSSLAPLSPQRSQDAHDPVASPGPEHECWQVPWIGPGLLAVPADASWPRFMTRPHPSAVDSYGEEFAAWSRARSGRPLRWWQRLAAARLLEHDAAGHLVWLWAVLSTSRQVGKSVLLGELALWRLDQSERWGEPQLALLVSKDVAAAQEVHRPALAWADAQGWLVRRANGQQQIEDPATGSRWAIRGSGSTYSYTVSLGLLDEAWSLPESVADDALGPTLAERVSPQLLLTSTAHKQTTGLLPKRRALGLAELDEPGELLLLEWSAPAGADLADRTAWRAASPHWSPRRERLIAAAHTAALAGGDARTPAGVDPRTSFACQWLNRWPAVAAGAGAGRDEPLLQADAWPALVDYTVGGPATSAVIAVEDHYGRGAAVAVATSTPHTAHHSARRERVAVWGRTYGSRADAFTAARQIAAQRPGARLLVGASLDGDPDIPADVVASVELASTTTTRTALPLVRELVASGRLVHDGGPELAGQIDTARVVEAATGGLNLSTKSGRSDLLRAASWAVAAQVSATGTLPFFIY
ncbi:hypothetical protein [Nocardioides sp. zg-1228]|uniref:hypothetical protein n=1 Tax=Nocardioides sp. zg-1228 TaxID=2763008 RepID=UPI001642FC3B|nr:hypothetical protein [Nocardioides sp. zg-1228]MBC2934702.1 hypothetical protein [Nocardioides sp. zg-1228]QSF56020.1 hypothetical protein JX575_09965 [Nocardioides sp. zg-1228]